MELIIKNDCNVKVVIYKDEVSITTINANDDIHSKVVQTTDSICTAFYNFNKHFYLNKIEQKSHADHTTLDTGGVHIDHSGKSVKQLIEENPNCIRIISEKNL